jgi:hypothetical protein
MQDTIQVLVEAIKQEGKEFLRVVLVGSRELRSVRANRFLYNHVRITHSAKQQTYPEHGGVQMRKLGMRHLIENARERTSQLSLCSHGIDQIYGILPPPV